MAGKLLAISPYSIRARAIRSAASLSFSTIFKYVLAFNVATLLFLFSSCLTSSSDNHEDFSSSSSWSFRSLSASFSHPTRFFKKWYSDNDLITISTGKRKFPLAVESLKGTGTSRFRFPKPGSKPLPFPVPQLVGWKGSGGDLTVEKDQKEEGGGRDRRGMAFDDALASKMFHGALQPVHISPYHWTGERTPGKEEVTVTTHITPDRLEVFMKLVGRNLGPISCTLHIDDDENADRILDVVNAIRSSSPMFRKNVDVHVVRDKFGRQYNLWRNLARFFSRTDYYLLLDVDFSVRTDIQKALRLALHSPSSPIAETLASGEAALVLPAFEYAEDAMEPELPDPNAFEPGVPETIRRLSEESGVVLCADPPQTSQRDRERKEHYNDVAPENRYFPTTKKSLVRQVDSGRITMFHAKWRRGHGPTDYARWHESTEPYIVKEYEPAYEPYVIVRKDAVPWCEERFVGYGANKAACIMQMYMSGVSFWVSPDAFVMHQAHGYPELNRRSERPHNRRLYERFFHENCFRGARQFVSAGLWDTPRAFNLRRECGKKVKRFEEQLHQYFDTS